MSFYLYSRQTTAIYKKISDNANVKTLPDADVFSGKIALSGLIFIAGSCNLVLIV
jgi:hypothetical protein